MSIKDFLVMLAGGGAAAAFSWIAERFPKWHTLASETRKWISFGGTCVLALGAFAINLYVPVAVLGAIAPWFAIVAGIFIAFFMNQEAHQIDPLRIRLAASVVPGIGAVEINASAGMTSGVLKGPR